jgi:uncharacterized protein (DUF488 family)
MCAEKYYWKCHRQLLSDYLLAQGVNVEHIIEIDRKCGHQLTQGAVITDASTVIYPSTARKEPEKLLPFDT